MLPVYLSFLTGYAGVTVACLVIALGVLLFKVLMYFLWKGNVVEVEGQVLDVRKVTSKGGIKYFGGYVVAVQYVVDSVVKIGFLYRPGRYVGAYKPPSKLNVYFSTTGLTRSIRERNYLPLMLSALVSVELFLMYAAIGNITLFFSKWSARSEALMVAIFLLILGHAIHGAVVSSVTWGSVYRSLYMDKTVGYSDCNIKGGTQDRYDKILALESKVHRG